MDRGMKVETEAQERKELGVLLPDTAPTLEARKGWLRGRDPVWVIWQR